MKIPITKLYFDKNEEKMASLAIRRGWVSQGPKVAEFENKVAEYVNAKYAVATSSCTTALHLALIVSGIEKGDEVIVPSYTFIATANAVIFTGAKPVFADIDPATYNIDPKKIQKIITSRTRAIIPVHQIGLPADMDAIIKIAKKNKLKIIEDAACALGSEYKGKKIGGFSELTCFSFHPRKIITTGEGGMITTNNRLLAEKLRILRHHGMSVSPFTKHGSKKIIFENYTELGYNYRMTDIQASIGICQMEKIDEILKKRIYYARRYNQKLKVIAGLEIPFVPGYAKHNYQSYIIRIKSGIKKSIKQIMQELLEKGIATRNITAIHKEPYYYNKFGKMILPVTEEAARTTVLIPLYPSMTDREQDYVIKNLKNLLK